MAGLEMRRDGLARTAPVLFGEIVREEDYIASALAQWRHPQWEDIEAPKEIGPKAGLRHFLLEVPVRRRYHPHVRLERHRAADALELPLLDGSQQLGLHRGRELAYLVQEEGTAVGELEAERGFLQRARVENRGEAVT